MTLIEILRAIISNKSGGVAAVLSNGSDEPVAARTLEERQAVRADLDRLAAEGERTGRALTREHERALAAYQAAQAAAEDARRVADRAKTVRDAHSWGIEARKSRLIAILERGAAPIIDTLIAELDRQWQAARVAGRNLGTLRAPLSEAELADNKAADANLQGFLTAQLACESLKPLALSDAELGTALERIVAAIPSRYPQQEQAIELPRKNGSSGRPRLAHDSAKAVA